MKAWLMLLLVPLLTAGADWNREALDELVSYVQSQKTTGFLILENR